MEPGLLGACISTLPLGGCLGRGRLSPGSQGFQDWHGAQSDVVKKRPTCPQGWQQALPTWLSQTFSSRSERHQEVHQFIKSYSIFPMGLKNGEGGLQLKTS